MKDKDHKMLEEAWKQVYVEEPNMSPEEAHEAHGRGETLIVKTADNVEFVVDPANDDTVEVDPQNGLVFRGSDPDGLEVEVRADDISMIKSLSDKESIRGGFDPSNPNASLDPSNPTHRLAKIGSDEHYGEENDHEEEKEDKKKKNSHEWDDRSKKYFKPKKLAQEEDSLEDITEAHWSQGEAHMALKSMMKAIRDLEPAGDVREFYKDARIAGVDKSVLAKILDDAVESEDLHPAEAHFIQTGREPDGTDPRDPSDVGHRGFDKFDDSCGPDNAKTNEEDKIKRVIIKRIKLMKPESTKVTEGDKKKDKDKEKENEKKLKAKMDADQWYAQYGGQSPYGD